MKEKMKKLYNMLKTCKDGILVAIFIATCVSLVSIMSRIDSLKEFQQEAVNRGFAEYVVITNSYGSTEFKWKDPK